MARIAKNDLEIIFVLPTHRFEFLGVGLLISCLKVKGFSNIRVMTHYDQRLAGIVRSVRYGVLAFASFSSDSKELIAAARKLKRINPGVVTVFGGPHATFVPDVLLEDGVDAVCIGEGEEALPEFFQEFIDSGGEIPQGVRNFWVKDRKGQVHKNELRPLIRDLDELPFGDKSYFLNCMFFKKGYRRFVFSRGCPNQCAYCSINAFPRVYGLSSAEYYRAYSPQRVVEEIRSVIARYGGNVVGMIDSIFGISPEWLDEFASRYRSSVGLPFYCNAEARMVNERYVDALKKAGCSLIFMGLESGNNDVRNTVLNKHFDNRGFKEVARLVRSRGIKLGLYNIIGIPGGSLADDLATLRMNQEIRPFITFCGMFSFFPGTAMTEEFCGKAEAASQCRILHHGYFPVFQHYGVRKDFWKLNNLFHIFDLCVYGRLPMWLVKLLVHLPIFRLSQAMTFLCRQYRLNRISRAD